MDFNRTTNDASRDIFEFRFRVVRVFRGLYLPSARHLRLVCRKGPISLRRSCPTFVKDRQLVEPDFSQFRSLSTLLGFENDCVPIISSPAILFFG
jgi:hypothetical protein